MSVLRCIPHQDVIGGKLEQSRKIAFSAGMALLFSLQGVEFQYCTSLPVAIARLLQHCSFLHKTKCAGPCFASYGKKVERTETIGRL